MQYKPIDEQTKEVIKILKKNKDLMNILNYISEINLPNFYIAAGCIFQTIWNYFDNKPLNYGIKDIDIIYYDKDDISKETEIKIEKEITNHFKKINNNYKFDIHNEARMHLWEKEKNNIVIDQYKNSEDAINNWIVTIHAIGITKENGEIMLYAPYGLDDIFSRTVRPIKHKTNTKEKYYKKVNSWKDRFNNLNIIEW